MPLGSEYPNEDGAIARSLEVVGERWTVLILRDLFYGMRRFNDLRKHIGLPPATLTDRLKRLVESGVAQRVPGPGARDEYTLTLKGESLWPIIFALHQWGDAHYGRQESRTFLSHRECDTILDEFGGCRSCNLTPPARDIMIQKPLARDDDEYGRALKEPHRLLQPLYF